MSHVTGREAAAQLRRWRDDTAEELARIAQAEKQGAARRSSVAAEHEAAWQHLTTLLLPALEPTALDAASGRVSLPALSASSTAARREARRRELAATLAQVQADARYVHREAQLNALDIRLTEVGEHLAPLEEALRLLRAEPLFDELIEARYGIEGYQGRFWHLSYYRHWKHGDLVVEKHGPRLGVQDFAGVRARFLQEREACETLRQEERTLLTRREAIQALVRRHDDAAAGLERLDDWTLATARALAREHLAALGDEDRLALFSGDAGLSLAAKRVSGTEAKTRYLEALDREWLSESKDDLRRRLDKLTRGTEKFARPKNLGRLFDEDEIAAKYQPREESWAKRRHRYEDASQRIVVFEDYAASTAANVLWWDLMTHHRYHHGIREAERWHADHGDRGVSGAVAAAWQDRQSGGWDTGREAS